MPEIYQLPNDPYAQQNDVWRTFANYAMDTYKTKMSNEREDDQLRQKMQALLKMEEIKSKSAKEVVGINNKSLKYDPVTGDITPSDDNEWNDDKIWQKFPELVMKRTKEIMDSDPNKPSELASKEAQLEVVNLLLAHPKISDKTKELMRKQYGISSSVSSEQETPVTEGGSPDLSGAGMAAVGLGGLTYQNKDLLSSFSRGLSGKGPNVPSPSLYRLSPNMAANSLGIGTKSAIGALGRMAGPIATGYGLGSIAGNSLASAQESMFPGSLSSVGNMVAGNPFLSAFAHPMAYIGSQQYREDPLSYLQAQYNKNKGQQ